MRVALEVEKLLKRQPRSQGHLSSSLKRGAWEQGRSGKVMGTLLKSKNMPVNVL